MALKIELGGGKNPRAGFTNIDICGGEDVIRCDLQRVGEGITHLPYANDEVDEVYTAHCLEHINPYKGVLHEIVRVCRIGADVTIIVPHWNQSLAFCWDHRCSISEDQVRHWSEFIGDWWSGCEKRLHLFDTKFIPSLWHAEASRLFPHLTAEQVCRFIPNACHEIQFFFYVVEKGERRI